MFFGFLGVFCFCGFLVGFLVVCLVFLYLFVFLLVMFHIWNTHKKKNKAWR